MNIFLLAVAVCDRCICEDKNCEGGVQSTGGLDHGRLQG